MNKPDPHQQAFENLSHSHEFAVINQKGERRTGWVLAITLVTLLLEIAAGTVFGSMALLADGWHMATHAAAFMVALFAYRYARIHADDGLFAFSPGKVGVLGSFISSVVLGMVALLMLVESCERFFAPHTIYHDEALLIACFGLLVNVICALLLRDHHSHDGNDHDHHHHDKNLKAAYFHVLADALTSVLAIAALLAGKYYGLDWLDSAMGAVGSLVIGQWAYSLMREAWPLLADESLEKKYQEAIQQAIENDADNRVCDLHVWRVGPGHFAVILSVVSHAPQGPDHYKRLLEKFQDLGHHGRLSHITVEVHRCLGEDCPG